MKEKNPLMAHKSSAEESDAHHKIPFQSLLESKKPHQSQDDYMEEQVQEQLEGPGFLSTCNIDDSDEDETQKQTTPSSSASKTRLYENEEIALQELVFPSAVDNVTRGSAEPCEALAEDSGRERLKRHRVEVAGRVWIPEIWGQEKLLKDWIDCSAFDAPLVPSRIMSARAALVQDGRRANAGGIRIENRC